MKKSLITQYMERFRKNFPIYAPLPKGKSLDQVITECLKENKPFEPVYDDRFDY